jgi:hypothetical protein
MIEAFSAKGSSAEAMKLPAGMRWFGWAGWLQPIPDSLRLYEVGGHWRRGLFALADRDRPRLEFAWDILTRRRFDFRRIAGRKLGRVTRRRPADILGECETVASPAFASLLCYHDQDGGCDRYVGYAAATRRIVLIVHHLRGDRLDSDLQQAIRNRLADQPLANDQRWAFFGISFVAPPGFEHESAQLNLGDMSVTLLRRDRARQPRLGVRQIYPARLALSRNGLEGWLEQLLGNAQTPYLPDYRHRLLRRGLRIEPWPSSLGAGLTSVARMPLVLRPFLGWRQFPVQRTWLFHDQPGDRLIVVQIAGLASEAAAILDRLLRDLHWAGETN